MPITEFREAAYPQEVGEAFPWLLLLEHPDLDAPMRLTTAIGTWMDARNWYEFVALGETWVTAPFEVIEPQQNDEEPRGSLSIQNVTQEIGRGLDAIDGPLNVTLTAVLEGLPNVIVRGPYAGFVLQNVRVDPIRAMGDLTFPSLSERAFPREWVRQSKFRGAYRALA